MKKKRRNRVLDRTLWLNIALILAFFSVMSLGIYLVRDKLLYNANEMGNSLAKSYSNEEESRISVYGMLLRMCALYTDTAIDNEDPAQAMQQGLPMPFAVTSQETELYENIRSIQELGISYTSLEEGMGKTYRAFRNVYGN